MRTGEKLTETETGKERSDRRETQRQSQWEQIHITAPVGYFVGTVKEKRKEAWCAEWFPSLSHSLTRVKTHPRQWQVHVAAHFLACNPAFIAPSCNLRNIRSMYRQWHLPKNLFFFFFFSERLEICAYQYGNFGLVCCNNRVQYCTHALISGFVLFSITSSSVHLKGCLRITSAAH